MSASDRIGGMNWPEVRRWWHDLPADPDHARCLVDYFAKEYPDGPPTEGDPRLTKAGQAAAQNCSGSAPQAVSSNNDSPAVTSNDSKVCATMTLLFANGEALRAEAAAGLMSIIDHADNADLQSAVLRLQDKADPPDPAGVRQAEADIRSICHRIASGAGTPGGA